MGDRQKIIDNQKGVYGVINGVSSAKGAQSAVDQMHEETFHFINAAGSPLAEVGYVIRKPCKVVKIDALPGGDLTTAASNYITGTVAKRDGAGGAASTIGSFTTNSTGGAALADFEPTSVAIDEDNATFAAGQVLTYKLVDAGTTTEPAIGVTVTVRYL